MTTPVNRGSCMCGEFRFETRGEPLWVACCHCESCRRHTGAPLTTYVGFRRDAVRFVPRDPPFYESSPGVRRRFCPHCGTPLSYEGASYAGELHLHVSGFEHPERFEPTAHVAYSEHLPWLRLADDLPRKD